MKSLIKFRTKQVSNDCSLIIGIFLLLLFSYWIFIFSNPLLGKNTSPNFSYNYSLFENSPRKYNITKNYVRIVSDNNLNYLNELKNFLINVENITHVEVYNNSTELYDVLKKSYSSENLTNLTIQLDIKNITIQSEIKNETREEINFHYKMWELIKNTINKSSNEFYISLNYDDKIKSLEKIKIFANYQKIITNFITYLKHKTSPNNNLKVIVESSQFINAPNEKLYQTSDKNKRWIFIFSLWIIVITSMIYSQLFEERKNNFIDYLYRNGIKAYQNYISLLIFFSYFLFFYGISEFLILEWWCFNLTISSLILCFIAIFFFIIQTFLFNLFLYNLFRKRNIEDYLLVVMVLIYIIFIISNGFNFYTSDINKVFMIFPNICFIVVLLNIMKINYFQSFSLDLLNMNDLEEITYFDYLQFSIILIIIYIVLILFTSLFYQLISNCNCFKKKNLIEDNFNLTIENNTKYHQELNKEEEDYQSQNNYLRIIKLTKKYDEIIAINNLSFNFYPNQIFCLIGQNGAGKTTLIKMIYGLEEPNEGNILFGKESLIKNKKFLYENIGICVQDKFLSDDLTINEYIGFLLQIKGKYKNEEEISNLLQEFKLDNTKNIKRLSYDEIKKLIIIIAFLGNNKIILLDEPTSGVSRETRDLICNYLKKNKTDKIIIFTTHSLEEVEFLADKIGIIKDGEIICSGTTSFIKNIYPNSFNLNLIFGSTINEESKNELIEKINDCCQTECRVKIFSDTFLQLNISDADFDVFFEYLDNEAKEPFSIKNYSISTTTLEDIFIFLNEEKNKDELNNDNIENLSVKKKKAKKNINTNQELSNIYLNIKKNITYLMKCSAIIFQLIYIIIILILFYEAKQNLIDKEDFINIEELIKKSEINIYTNEIDYLNNSYYLNSTKNKIKFNNFTNFETISDFAYFIKNNSKLMNERSAILFKKENGLIKIYNLYQGSAPDYFQATMNMLINIICEKEYNLYINSGKEYGDLNIFIYFNDKNLYIYIFVIEIIIICINYLSHIPFIEKQNNIKHLFYLNGKSKFNYWIGIFISDIFRIIIYIIILFIFLYIQEFNFYILIDITLCLFASCIFIYFISLYYSQSYIFMFYIILHFIIFTLIFLSYLMLNLYSLFDEKYKNFPNILENGNYIFTISDIFPITSLTTLFIRLLINDNSIYNEKSKNENLLFIYKIIFCIQIIVYGFLFYLIEFKKNDIKEKINKISTLKANDEINEELKESNLIDNNISNDVILGSLQIINLTYKKGRICEKTEIIKNVNLKLEINEKLGIYGKSGSGKSSILKSIIQENEYSGEIYFLRQNLKENFNLLRNDIGYCPQKNILIDDITLLDFINFYKDNSNDLEDNFDVLINLFGLTKYLNKKCKTLSEGNKRKLSFVISILNNPKLLLLDEPTVGIDTKSRKIIWNYIKKLDYKYNMILVSNDIEEIEYLCDKVCILKGNSECKTYNIEELKIGHSIGYIFKLNFKKENINYENNEDLLDNLKNKIKNLDQLDDNFKKDYECLNKLNQIIDYLDNNYSEIELNNSSYDNFSLQFIIKIDDEKKGKLFSLIFKLKNKNFILDILIQNESLEKIIPNLLND